MLAGAGFEAGGEQQAWLGRFVKALGHATVQGGVVIVRAGSYGPVPIMRSAS
jgi:hypothetical protein